ncbi:MULTISPECIES: helix-turn-helix domain-containing protein [Marinomonas]|uniref:Helix-turn-helix domain-containing protein n=1 Tax=Marinomonas rhodophyticola TaxID=2992803 RepID=A0ABT3KGJ4_9GAMM|nr:helix-turn-helix transcriptional regulator [Marinomonas sp. KJ51-3]MCW4629669.1 helix-turn-helix domain-containing protein [Marinomonas sp. KJ51-3]
MSENIKCNHKILFGKRLKKLRQEKGVSQESLALTAGLDRTYVSGCERGLRNIGLENIYKLAIALEVSPELLFKEED